MTRKSNNRNKIQHDRYVPICDDDDDDSNDDDDDNNDDDDNYDDDDDDHDHDHDDIPDICYRHHRRCLWRIVLSCVEFSSHNRLSCGEILHITDCHGEKFST